MNANAYEILSIIPLRIKLKKHRFYCSTTLPSHSRIWLSHV